jgi:hypothetical protein
MTWDVKLDDVADDRTQNCSFETVLLRIAFLSKFPCIWQKPQRFFVADSLLSFVGVGAACDSSY